jgi:hypothetical protein
VSAASLVMDRLAPAVKMPPAKDIAWCPQPGSQVAFLACPVVEVLYEGTRGGGKSDTLLMDFGKEIGRFGAAWRGILFRQTFPQLADIIQKTKRWFPLIWPAAVYNEAKHEWRWPGGETLLLRHFQRDSDYWNYHGHEYSWIAWEELCNWATATAYKAMFSCLRSSTPGIPKRVRATANPYGPGHGWVKARFRLPYARGKVIRDSVGDDGKLEPARVAIHGRIEENRLLLAADPDYIARIRASARNEAELKAWLEGDWDIVAGGMFDDVWDPKVHVLKPFKIPSSWRLDRSFDWGSSAPFSVGWWAESDGSDVQMADGFWRSTVRGDLFRIGEWYGWNGKPNEGLRMLAVDVAAGIIGREIVMGVHGRVRPGPADTSIFDVENGNCIADDMAKQVVIKATGARHPGPTFTRADKSAGSRKTGWEAIRKMLQAAKRPEGRPREMPGLFVFSICEQFLRTIPVLPRDDDDLDDVDTDAEDHIADEARYRVRAAGTRVSDGRVVGMF